ncbi:MAG TPA: M13 family metallopeptidase, partial [Chthoniobacterales bacterium]|nr:M13 family metallopeptidase [Chthoniobacterales bacterium]
LFPVLLMTSFSTIAAESPIIDPANLDTRVKPGDDFYQYANGGWLARNPIPPEYSRWGSFQELIERNYATLHEILEESSARLAKGEAPPGSVRQLVGQFYASGMNEQQINAEGARPLQSELQAIAQITDRKQLASVIGHLHRLGVGALFDITGGQDAKDSKNQIAIASQGGLGLPDRDYYIKEGESQMRDQYVEHVTKMLRLLGDTDEKASTEAKQILAFETELAKASKTRVQLRDPEANYHRMSAADLAKLTPGFDWPTYFETLGISDDQLVKMDVEQPEFFQRAAELTANTSLEDWKVYLRWHLIHATAADLSTPFVDENFRFFKQKLTGVKQNLPRWKRILQEVDHNLGEALGQLYVEKKFTPEAKQRALVMVNDLKNALRGKIQNLDWIGPETREFALKKLDVLGVKIGYPDKWRDYSKLQIKDQPHVLNALAASAFETERQLAKIGKPVDPTEWGMSPPTVNAYYSPNRNEIVFPAGILQPPFFNAQADDPINYGGIGAVIGHEMTHGFDDQGRRYDAEGNLKNWWTAEDEKRFQERGTKIVQQFDSYVVVDNLHVNGQLTEGENIADLGGVKIAYAALEKALGRKPEADQDQRIEDFTPKQRFFLSWAQIWRANVRRETLRLFLQIDPHSPAKFRVNGPLSNLPEFSRSFDVPDNSPMIRPPDERVQIW